MFPLIIPIGDLEDVAAVDAVQALQGNEEGLARIASRYGTSNVLVATATQVNRGGRVSIDMRLQWHGPLRSGSEVSGLRALEGESIDALMARFVTRTVNGLEEQWKSQTLLRFNLERRLSARVPPVVVQPLGTLSALGSSRGSLSNKSRSMPGRSIRFKWSSVSSTNARCSASACSAVSGGESRVLTFPSTGARAKTARSSVTVENASSCS